LYGPKFAVGSNPVAANAGADHDSAAQAATLAQSARSAKSPLTPLDILSFSPRNRLALPAY
jgi:hypothetical protein